MIIPSKKKLNAYINKRNNQIFYISLPFSGDVAVNINSIGTALPFPSYCYKETISSPSLNFYKFEYIYGGKGTIESGGINHDISKGDLVFIRKNIEYIMRSDKEAPLEKHFVSASGKFLEGALSAHEVTSPIFIIKKDVLAEFESIIDYLKSADSVSHELIDHIEIELLKIIQNLSHAISDINATHVTRAENILGFIEQNLTKKLTIKEITAAFFISKSQLIRIFKEKYQTTPMKYVVSRKIDLAKYYLKKTDMSIGEISALLCFADREYFTKVFKKQVGLAPVDYRKAEYFDILCKEKES